LNEEKIRLDQFVQELEKLSEGIIEPINMEELQQELNSKVNNIVTAMDLLPVEQAKALIQTLIQFVVVHGGEDIEIRLQPV
jgi:site-specific DNA recombinase